MLLFEGKKWTLLNQHERRIEATEMNLLVSLNGCHPVV